MKSIIHIWRLWNWYQLKVSEQENSEAPVSEPKEDEKTKKD